jgi:diguanylate cyclase (GGDEF)-like protein
MDLNSIWKRIIYGNVDKEFYGYHNDLIIKINKKTTKLLYILAFIFCAILSLVYLIPHTKEADRNAILYVIFTFLYGLICILAYFCVNKYKKSVHILFWIFELICLINVLFISVYFIPNEKAVVIYFIVMILPMVYICKPWQSLLEVMIAYAIFLSFDAYWKRDYPLVFNADLINSCLFIAITVFATIYIRNLHVSALHASILFKKEAQIDKLTNMFNKSAIEAYSKEVLKDKHGNLGLVIIDIDDFKFVNDRWGHNQGDRFLSQVARTLNKSFEGSGILGRIGGDEFMILLENIYDNDIIISKVKNSLETISKSFSDYSSEKITCSCGIAFLKDSETIDFDEFYKEADRALYLAKDRGKNQCVVYKPFDDKNKHPLILAIMPDETSEAIVNEFLRDDYNLIFANDEKAILEKIEDFKVNLRGFIIKYDKDLISEEIFKNKVAGLSKYNIPLIVISNETEIESECLKLGATEFIHTPSRKDVVLLRVKNALRKRA